MRLFLKSKLQTFASKFFPIDITAIPFPFNMCDRMDHLLCVKDSGLEIRVEVLSFVNIFN
jgi:hypothetical protein